MLIKSFIFLFLISLTLAEFENNVCNTFGDYLHSQNNRNCWYNPDAFLDTPELIQKYAGVFQRYEIMTEDGYILTMFRIPRKNPKGVILLQHPLLVDSRIYLSQGNDSLAMFLWTAGYDIWLNNQRGSMHSEKHVNLTTSDLKYWDFSFHEIGKYDVPAEIRLIQRETKSSKIIYFGNSLGTTVGLVYSTLYPEDAKKAIGVFILSSTAWSFKYNNNVIGRFLTNYRDLLSQIFRILRMGSVLPVPKVLPEILGLLTRTFPIGIYFTHLLLLLICGWTPNEADPAQYGFDTGKNLRNISWKLFLHFLQMADTPGHFQMFDYGPEINKEMYGMNTPALYPIENISVPTYLISSTDDGLTTFKDSQLLYERLPKEAKKYGQHITSGLNHYDFFVGKHRKKLFYDPAIDFINKL